MRQPSRGRYSTSSPAARRSEAHAHASVWRAAGRTTGLPRRLGGRRSPALPRLRSLVRSLTTSPRAFCACCPFGRGATIRSRPAPCCRTRLPRQRTRRRSAVSFASKGLLRRTRPLRRLRASPTRRAGRGPGVFLGARPGARGRRRQRHARTPRLREPDRNRLLCRSRAVLPLADVVNFFTHELARLRARGLPRSLVPSSSLDRPFLWHLLLRRRRSPYSHGRTRVASHDYVLQNPGTAGSEPKGKRGRCRISIARPMCCQ